MTVIAGLSLEQAQVLAELFSGKTGMLANPAPCTIAELQNYYSRCVLLSLAAYSHYTYCCCLSLTALPCYSAAFKQDYIYCCCSSASALPSWDLHYRLDPIS